ncbi:hypothetical protein [Teichococcus aestuarii]|uniref:hypothetical protein n=1 Tax=Teichococcus aestuarii TaxID=568898 RepID=UPI003616442E
MMTPASLPLAPGLSADLSVAPRFAALTLELVDTVAPNSYLLDTLYPLSLFLLSGGKGELGLFPENIPEKGAEFYAGFRQYGGRRSILPFAEALPAARRAALSDGRPLLVAMHADNSASAASALGQCSVQPALLLLAADRLCDSQPPLYAVGYKGHCVVKFVQGSYEESFCFVSPIMDTGQLSRAFEIAGKSVSVDLKSAASLHGAENDTIIIYLADDYAAWSNASVSALSLVHDGEGTVEGDASYSWLWGTGRNQLRILLGPVSHRYRRLRVILPNTISVTNLQQAELLLNGEVVKPRAEIWSDTSGALSIDLPPDLSDPLVLGIWVRESKMADDKVTRLFACVDRIELSA